MLLRLRNKYFRKMLKILIDDREQAIIPHFKEYDNVELEVKRLHIGDYSITRNDKVLFCIERKTWCDLSASIKDGRDANIEKMLSLREQTNCKLLMLIEGKARYKPTKKFARIPYKNLQAKLDHLMVRDNINIIYSDNEEDTPNRLVEFCKNYQSLNISEEPPAENSESIEASIKSGGDIDILTKSIPKTDRQIIQNIWNTLPQITTKTSDLFINRGIHISDLIMGRLTESEVSSMKYENGTIIGKRAVKILKITSPDNYKYFCNILTEIPGITKKTAALILVKATFMELLSGELSVEDLANIQKTEKSKIGKTAANNIFKFLIKQ